MTDLKQEIKSYSPIDLDRLLKRNIDMPDNLKNSILLYNKALDNIRIKSEDIAIIELKKAISLNPEFCEALNLLGLLYASINEKNLAINCFEKVLSIDSNDKKALEYKNFLAPNTNRSGNAKVKQKEKKENNKPTPKSKKKNNQKNSQKDSVLPQLVGFVSELMKKDAVKYIIGFIAGLLVFLLISTIVNSGGDSKTPSNVSDDVYENKSSVDFEKELSKLIGEKEALQAQLEELKKAAQDYSNLSQLLAIDKEVSEENYVTAADMLVAFKDVELNEIGKEKYENLKKRTMEKAAQQVYNEGRNLYKNKQFKEALEKFDKVLTYVDNWKNSEAMTYYIGVCHLELNDRDKAMEAFNKVITQYPSGSYVQYAKSRLNSMNSGT